MPRVCSFQRGAKCAGRYGCDRWAARARAADSGKAKRLAHTDRVELAPSTTAGKPLGGTVAGSARAVIGGARPAFRGVMRPTGPLFWSWVLYRIRRHDMSLYEVVPVGDWPENSRNPGQ